MIRHVKVLGLALVAVFALGATLASGASAFSFHFNSKSPDGHTIVKGTQIGIHKITTTAGEITCEEASVTGTMTETTATDITLTPTYSKCHINFFGSKVSATINMNGCQYTLTSHQTVGGATLAANKHLVNCTKAMEVVAAGCTIKINTGQTIGGLTIANGAGDIVVTTNSTGIAYSHSGFTCGTGSGTTGTYKGETTLKGSDTEGKQVTLSYDQV